MTKTTPRKVVLLTGASSGIGHATVELLLRQGYIVYGTARRMDVTDHLRQSGAHILPMDVTREEDMDRVVREVISAESRIDVLINNAGFGSAGALEDVALSEARSQFEVNVFGLSRMTQLVLPHMRARGTGTVVNLSSLGGRIATPLSGWYNATKFSVEALSDALRQEVKPFGINVVIIEPGGIQTHWSGTAAAHAMRNSGSTVYGKWVEQLLEGFKKYDRFLSPPERIAALIARALRASLPKTRYVAGFGARPGLLARKLLPDRWLDAVIRRQFS
jgi:short-subunit dehydrogenase